ncbi:PREDICTED: leucine-rich repeat extensin-like protein 5 [Tarenaya hassleriana]|uniref:leucine-rich repeat extensin-like protein 5 n=1 Tax=Tarenaya hassleriana TaxID=28532 RepID=UPI00053C5538|nr:PREDICTED: leucine-rich repeat extensin-like protein 5 [Tarenaya hassleriana]
MGTNRVLTSICLLLCLSISAGFFIHCDAKRSIGLTTESKKPKIIRVIKHTLLEQMMTQLNLAQQLDSSTSNTQPYGVSSPFSLPPYDSLPPVSIPQNAPPFCVYPPNTPQTPTSSNSPPSPSSYPGLSPPPGPIGSAPNSPGTSYPNPPVTVPNPPSQPNPTFNPSPSGPTMGSPYYEPGPPTTYIPTPSGGSGSVPSPSGFLPPIVYPPPMVPPPPSVTPSTAYWCVAKPTVPDPIMQEAMNYACGSGADCSSIQPNGPCFQPNILWAHASFAFNSYWQRSKGSGGSCAFGGTGMLVTVDPSYDGCHFEYF